VWEYLAGALRRPRDRRRPRHLSYGGGGGGSPTRTRSGKREARSRKRDRCGARQRRRTDGRYARETRTREVVDGAEMEEEIATVLGSKLLELAF
jgi:hypothetical protein